MPNNITCSVTIQGNDNTIEQFKEKVKHDDSDLSFEHLVDEFQMYEGWGTPLGMAKEVLEIRYHDDSSLTYVFLVTQRPPHEFFHEMSAMFPELHFHFTYTDMVAAYRGDDKFQNGEVLKHEVEDINREDFIVSEEEVEPVPLEHNDNHENESNDSKIRDKEVDEILNSFPD